MRIHKEGIKSIIRVLIISIVISLLLLLLSHFAIYSWIITSVLIIFSIFIISFYRFPCRGNHFSDDEVVASADGKVVKIKEVEEKEYFHGKAIQISIFMSFFNVHVNWYPAFGETVYFKYHPGHYLAAWHPKSSIKNERTTVVVRNPNGQEVLFRQIAGLFARRVVSYAEMGKKVHSGDELGFIKFGSRADIFLPIGTEIRIKKGDKVRGGDTIIAKLKGLDA